MHAFEDLMTKHMKCKCYGINASCIQLFQFQSLCQIGIWIMSKAEMLL